MFPVFVRVKDSGVMFVANSIEELQYHFEPIDVENGEYEAWDFRGNPISLAAQRPIWLEVRPSASPASSMKLEDAISDFAARYNVPSESLRDKPLADAVRYIESQSEKHRKGLFLRVFGI